MQKLGRALACLLFTVSFASVQENEQAMMERMMKLAAPGEHHAHLEMMAGNWQQANRMRMGPDAPWIESKSTSSAEFILGGRFLTQTYKGEAMMGSPQPFEGFGIMGFDNQKAKYTSLWLDRQRHGMKHA